MDELSIIASTRLDLFSLTPEFLLRSRDGDQAVAEELLALSIPDDWYVRRSLMRLRLKQLMSEPAYQPWSLRAIGLREERTMIGHIGFHTQPGPAYLQHISSTGVEYGYRVYEPFQRQGYATEACRAMMQWAHSEHDVTEFVVTINPENVPSCRLTTGLGFQRVGSHIDEEDGLEDIYKLVYPGGDDLSQ